MRESGVWTWLNTRAPHWLAIERVEFHHPPGGSDCFYVDRRLVNGRVTSGWLELKYVERLPATYRIASLKPEQTMFLQRQARNDLPSGVLMREGGNWWHLWVADGLRREWAQEMLKGIPPTRSWPYGTFDFDVLMECLQHTHFYNARLRDIYAPTQA